MSQLASILPLFQLTTAILLVAVILIQQRGTGLGSAFGSGEGNVFATRRGAERWIFIATILFSVLFLTGALASFLVR